MSRTASRRPAKATDGTRCPHGAPRGAPARRAGAIARGRTVVSDLTGDESVTDAEIRLLLAVLGDTLNDILAPPGPACPIAPPQTHDA